MKLENFDSIVDVRKWYADNNQPTEMEISHKYYYRLETMLTSFQREELDKEGKFGEIKVNKF